jgi:hypothetical protein
MAGANRANKQARDQQRILYGSKLKERVEAYAQLKQDARIEAVHDALMFSIDRILEDNPRAFTGAQAEVLRDVSFHLVHLILPASDKPKGLIRGCIHQYKESDAFGKAKVIAAVVVGAVAAVTSLWTWGNAVANWARPKAAQVEVQRPAPSSAQSAVQGAISARPAAPLAAPPNK